MIQILNLCLHKQQIRLTKANLHFGTCGIFVINLITLFQTASEKQREDKKRKQINFSSRPKSPVKSNIQNFKAYKKQVLPIKQVCSYPVNYHSRIGYDSRNHLSARNPYSSYRSSQLRSPSISRSREKPR